MSATDVHVRGRLRLHRPSVPAEARFRRQMACGKQRCLTTVLRRPSDRKCCSLTKSSALLPTLPCLPISRRSSSRRSHRRRRRRTCWRSPPGPSSSPTRSFPTKLSWRTSSCPVRHCVAHSSSAVELTSSTVEAVERAAGLTLFSDAVKANSKHICKSTKCEVIVRRFDDAQRRTKAIAAPK